MRTSAAIAMAKTRRVRGAIANSLDAMQIFGGAGYLGGCRQSSSSSATAVPSIIFSGTTEIQREIIAREAGL